MNKKESEDQAHIYVPAERKPKFEEPVRNIDLKVIDKPLSDPSKYLNTTKPLVNDQNIEKLMNTDINTDSIASKIEPMDISTSQENLNNCTVLNNKNKPILSNEDLINFKNSISYVSKTFGYLNLLVDFFNLNYIIYFQY